MHILAYIYHWGLAEIKGLPRSERLMWVRRIIEQKNQENKQVEHDIAEARANAKSPKRR